MQNPTSSVLLRSSNQGAEQLEKEGLAGLCFNPERLKRGHSAQVSATLDFSIFTSQCSMIREQPCAMHCHGFYSVWKYNYQCYQSAISTIMR